jgi:site-specific DNA-methyltransferase (adenine-specific)
MSHLAPLFTSHRQTWKTPAATFEALDREFGFTLDPCTVEQTDYDGLLASWEGERVFVNPPYSQCLGWIRKCYTEAPLAEVIVALVPSRTDTAWFHEYALHADELRFVRGRLKFDDGPNSAPFPSLILVYR